MRILIHVNTFAPVNQFVYASHINFFTDAVKNIPDLKLFSFTSHRSSIDRMRNLAAVQALKLECDYLMFLDDDVLVPPDTLRRLIACKKDIVAGMVVIRGLPFNLMSFQHVTTEEAAAGKSGFKNNIVDIAKETGNPVVDVDGVGFSCCLIHMDVIKAMEPPYFITGPTYTEDAFFCNKAQRLLTPTPTIAIDTSISCGHLMPAEPIQYETIEAFTKFYNEIAKIRGTDITPERIERNLDYLERTLKNLTPTT